MKKFLLVSCLLLIAVKGFSQQFSQYNTGTLFDSFENPAQRSFIPDTSKKFAFNFLIPNAGASFFMTGDAQSSIVSRLFSSKYNDAALQIGSGKYNNFNLNASIYSLMFKMFASVNGDEELGFFLETKADGRGAVTDESIALFNGLGAFPNNIYDNTFNDHYHYQIYNALGLSYRERLSNEFAVGVKLSLLMGIDYNKADIYESHVSLDQTNNQAAISLRGRYYASQGPGKFDSRSFLPTTRSPGAQISIGTSYATEDGITFQGNIKDLGFIHWYSASTVSDFNATKTVTGLSSKKRENIIFGAAHDIFRSSTQLKAFTSYTDARFELSATKSYMLNEDIKYSPTLIASKELMYNGFIGAMSNRFQYRNYNASLTASYDNQNVFSLGLQLMYKAPNGEFFIGSEKLAQSMSFLSASSNSAAYTNGSFTGADFFIGFSLKFGPVIEHPLNASTIPTGERGFLGRLYNRLVKTNW